MSAQAEWSPGGGPSSPSAALSRPEPDWLAEGTRFEPSVAPRKRRPSRADPRPTIVVSRDDLCLMTSSSLSVRHLLSETAERPFTRAGPVVRIRFPPAESPRLARFTNCTCCDVSRFRIRRPTRRYAGYRRRYYRQQVRICWRLCRRRRDSASQLERLSASLSAGVVDKISVTCETDHTRGASAVFNSCAVLHGLAFGMPVMMRG